MREKRLEGRVALVSGGSTGIGAAIVRRLAAEGAHVGLGDINTGDGEQVAQDVTAAGGSACFMPLDVTDASHWQEAVQKLVTEHGRLDILVNNAGIYARTPIDKIDEQEWQRVIDVNVKGVSRCPGRNTGDAQNGTRIDYQYLLDSRSEGIHRHALRSIERRCSPDEQVNCRAMCEGRHTM